MNAVQPKDLDEQDEGSKVRILYYIKLTIFHLLVPKGKKRAG